MSISRVTDSNNGLLLYGGRTGVISVSFMKTVSTYRSVSVHLGFNGQLIGNVYLFSNIYI